MFRVGLNAILAAAILSIGPLWAQDENGTNLTGDQRTIADIRQEVDFLTSQIDNLRVQLQRTTAPLSGTNIGNPIDRLQLIEHELRRITGRIEVLEFQLKQTVEDGTQRLSFINQRLAALDGDDSANDVQTPALGGGDITDTVENLTVAERQDFTRAQREFDAQNYATAAELFLTYTNTHPSSPKVAHAHYLRGEAYLNLSDHQNAGRGYLDSFTSDPDGAFAPGSLLKLGQSLVALNKTQQACRTFSELPLRYPDSQAADLAVEEFNQLACN